MMYQCNRCTDDTDNDGWYCDNCESPKEVDFEIEEDGRNFKGEMVCPDCYNQLVDKIKK